MVSSWVNHVDMRFANTMDAFVDAGADWLIVNAVAEAEVLRQAEVTVVQLRAAREAGFFKVRLHGRGASSDGRPVEMLAHVAGMPIYLVIPETGLGKLRAQLRAQSGSSAVGAAPDWPKRVRCQAVGNL